MEETSATDPLDISKEQDLIKDAQETLSKIDVLICGGCHEVFHFVEEFTAHKESNLCPNVTGLKCENEEKPQIWGFTLWKTKQIRTYKAKAEAVPTSWDIYQKWTKLTPDEKDLWITAGKTVQSIHKTATAKIIKDFPAVKDDKSVDKDPLALDDGELASMKNDSATAKKPDIFKTSIDSKKALRTTNDNEKEEYNVEKIMGKRFNNRKRIWEYEVKWENYAEATWEPVAHLENCKALVREFEEKLKEAKINNKPASGRGRGRPRVNVEGGPVKIAPKKPEPPPASVILTSPGGRPQRTSKQKALNQVKAWCGNISDEEGGLKRPFDDDGESDDSFEKRLKLDGDSEDTEDDEPKTPMKKIAKIIHTYNNGTGKKLPDNVLIPDAKGVVRISQKQLPSLSSGVYIMSKSSGIIKLDPTASKIATSGGQAIVKVSPKIGQTQIKIIKKDDGSKRVVQVKGPEPIKVSTPIPIAPKGRIIQTVVKTPFKKEIMKKPEITKTPPLKILETKKEEPKAPPPPHDEDSDDGLPELEFPTDLPLPEPDSPPGDFTLDPFTGKVAGMEYPEVPPPTETTPTNTTEEDSKKDGTPQSNLDNIVKLAAADITEEDLKSDAEGVVTTTSSVAATNAANATTSTPKASILSAAMVNSNILQKTLSSPRARTQPRIINQTVAKPRTTVGAVVRTPTQTRTPAPIRAKPVLPSPRSKFNISPVRNVYSAKTNNVSKPMFAKKVTTPVKKSPIKAASTPTKPISMPSLEEDPTPKVAQVVAEVPTVATELSTFALAAGDRPMFITGDDGTVYQVAGQNEEGQTILLTQDSEGQQQCLLVTSEAIPEEEPQAANPAQVLMEVQEPVEVAEEQPLVAQFIRTEPPSPGGTHKVVVMLPDGDVMVTQVTPEEYASLELDK